jgi:acyl dehydratase
MFDSKNGDNGVRMRVFDGISAIADATGDRQWIHVDPERAAAGPFGGTIAHGLLTLALLPQFLHQLYRVDNVSMAVNYGGKPAAVVESIVRYIA